MKGAGIIVIAAAVALGTFSMTPGSGRAVLMVGALICLVAGVALLASSAFKSSKKYAEEYGNPEAAEARLTKLRDDGYITEEQYEEQKIRRF